MIARSDAERRIRDALRDPHLSAREIQEGAAHLIDQIYGVDGADAVNPRYGTKHYQEHEAD